MKTIFTAIVLLASYQLPAQERYTFVFLNKNPEAEVISPEKSQEIFNGHMSNMKKLAREGKLITAGPFEDGGGIFILNTTSLDEAREWIKDDPGLVAKRWNPEILPYQPRKGGVCAGAEPIKMTTYTFVRFLRSDQNSVTKPDKAIIDHDRFLSTLNEKPELIGAGTFDDKGGGILIYKGEISKDFFADSPAVKAGLLEAVIRSIFIPYGSFCETH